MMILKLQAVIFWLISAAVAGFGAYFGAYLKKRGENLATHADIDKLVDQVKAVTTATTEIKTEIEKRVWSSERQWELKRDTLLAAVGALRRAQGAVFFLYSAYDVDMKVKGEEWKEKASEARIHASEALEIFNDKRSEASLVCSKVVNLAMTTPASQMEFCIRFNAQGEHKKGSDLIPRIGASVDLAIDFMRKEIGFRPLSSESSEVPSLALLNRSKES